MGAGGAAVVAEGEAVGAGVAMGGEVGEGEAGGGGGVMAGDVGFDARVPNVGLWGCLHVRSACRYEHVQLLRCGGFRISGVSALLLPASEWSDASARVGDVCWFCKQSCGVRTVIGLGWLTVAVSAMRVGRTDFCAGVSCGCQQCEQLFCVEMCQIWSCRCLHIVMRQVLTDAAVTGRRQGIWKLTSRLQLRHARVGSGEEKHWEHSSGALLCM